MPRYHFDTECGMSRYRDPDGVELDSIDQAQQQLLGLLRDLTFHTDTNGVTSSATVEVRCQGDIVLQGSCSLSIDRPSPWSPKL